MKTFILTAILATIIATNSFAQNNANVQKDKNSQLALRSGKRFSLLDEPDSKLLLAPHKYSPYQQPSEDEAKWRRLKGAGTALIVVGGASLLTGFALMERGIFHSGNRDEKIEAGIICVLSSMAAIGPGIPMLIKGNKELKKIKRQRGELTLHPAPTGGSLVYKF